MAIKGYKKMYAVDYEEGDGVETFEIFSTLKEAKAFYKEYSGKRIWVADFNKKNIYKEGKYWNYEDNSLLYIRGKTVKGGN